MLWLWGEQAGVFSHGTALALHDLSDALPARTHLTLPVASRRRRLRVPDGLVLHFAELGVRDGASFGAVSVTASLRTLRDCIEANLAPGLLDPAIHRARHRGLISPAAEVRLRDERRSSRAVA